jgi:hypothetical protein
MSNDQRINLANLSLSGLASGIIKTLDDARDHNFLAKGLARVPFPLQARLAKQYISRYNKKQTKAGFKANEWFRRTIAKLKPRFGVLFRISQEMPFPWQILNNKDKTKQYGSVTAKNCLEIVLGIGEDFADEDEDERTRLAYEKVGNYCETLGVTIQFWECRHNDLAIEFMQIALLKAECDKWWARKLKTVRKRYLELLEIATGQVGKDLFRTNKGRVIKRKGISPYSSKNAQAEFIESQISGRKYLERLELESDKGEVIDLISAVDAGMSNPKNRRNELMLRIRESEELAKEMGYVGVFYTLTCPSKYHPNSEKWDGSTPKEAQAYLVKTWSQTRAKLNRLGLNYFGIRVAEPHADGCPHWHMMLFMSPKKLQTANAIMRKYFINEDREELVKRYNDRNSLFKTYLQKRKAWGYKKSQGIKAKAPEKFYRTFTPRFTAITMDPNKGTAAGYIAKYISKNIDGFQMHDHEDAETSENITVNPVLAWASTWGIRQFQFQGSPSVTVYRELRRVRKPVVQITPLVQEECLERVRVAANDSQWKEFVKLMGGMCIGRNANFKTAYQETPFGNDYCEVVKRVKGVFTNTEDKAQAHRVLIGEYSVEVNASLITRDTEWVKQLKGTAELNKAEGLGFAFVNEVDQSWTSGNNCTPYPTATSAELKLSQLGLTEKDVNALKSGKRLLIKEPEKNKGLEKNMVYQLSGNKLLVFDAGDQIDKQKKDEIAHFAQSLARKEGRKVADKNHYLLASELVTLAFNHALNHKRAMPNGSDWAYAQSIADGEIEQDWWD